MLNPTIFFTALVYIKKIKISKKISKNRNIFDKTIYFKSNFSRILDETLSSLSIVK